MVLSQVVLQATRPSVNAVPKVVVSPEEKLVEGIAEEIDNEQVYSESPTPLSAAILLLLLLPEISAVFVATGWQVLPGVLADKRLRAAGDWVVWSPFVTAMTAC